MVYRSCLSVDAAGHAPYARKRGNKVVVTGKNVYAPFSDGNVVISLPCGSLTVCVGL